MPYRFSGENKRIAKNTMLLYLRMMFTMAVSLYTSRIVLNVLGVEDYGIYNVVGGVVAMFSFINSSMTSATQRYITFAIGRGEFKRLQSVFSTALQIHFLISVLVIILGETIGVWFLYNVMQIPCERMVAAFWVLQFSIVATAVMMVCIPYSADIIAHEKMSAFAYISILESCLKLAVVYILLVFYYDKLILYAFFILVVQLIVCVCYCFYCRKHFEESRYKHLWNKGLFKEMTGFAGWSMFGNLSAVLYGQGLNILLNVFYGPIVNAARAVAVQMQNAIQQFVGNFQMALNPQITKTYAKGEIDIMRGLMFRSARFSFYLLFILSLPVLFETDFILTIWLKTVPDNTVVFLRIMICTSLIYSLANPLIIANQATGKIRKYQTVCGTILLMILPISYVCIVIGCPAYSVFIVHFIMETVAQFARMVMLRPLIGIGLIDYLKNIYAKIVVVVLLSVLAPLSVYLSMADSVVRFFIVSTVCLVSVCLVVYTFGLLGNEREFVKLKILAVLNKVMNR